MSQPTATCPNCGAKVQFRWSSAVQTTCEYCQSILVRQGLDWNKVAEVADLPPDVSPIQLGSEGIYKNKAFTAVGRILYSYELGGWNEWHIVFNDGTSGWLSDAQAEYAITFLTQPESPIPPASALGRGERLQNRGVVYEVTTLTKAHYTGVQGELPFEYWDKSECLFADLRTPDARFATIDYTEDPALLFTGEFVDFDSLRMKNLREFEGWS